MELKLHKVENEVCRVVVGLNDVNSQVWATAAAMFSRSNEGVESIAEKLTVDKSGKFIENFYVGYGHESIGDNVDVMLFIEGIPFYVAALIEHHALFRGQESSTRYIDFSKQSACFDTDKQIYSKQIENYLAAVEKVKDNLLRLHRDHVLESEQGLMNRAISARTFDICRSLLPMAATTNVAWFGNIRTMKYHCRWMEDTHPWSRPYVDTIKQALLDVYAQSIGSWEKARVRKPWVCPYNLAYYTISGLIDFGSWRDLNRHRVGYHIFPNLLGGCDFHTWYKEMLTHHDCESYIPSDDIHSINEGVLGQNVFYSYSMPDKDQAEYFFKLRSKPTVHPTLRSEVHYWSNNFGIGCDNTPDPGPDGYILTRGNDTVVIK